MGSKSIFLPIRGVIMTLKKKRMKNLSHFTYLKEKFILQMSGLKHFLSNLFKINGFRNPSPKFHGFRGTHGTHANAATVSQIFSRIVSEIRSFCKDALINSSP